MLKVCQSKTAKDAWNKFHASQISQYPENGFLKDQILGSRLRISWRSGPLETMVIGVSI